MIATNVVRRGEDDYPPVLVPAGRRFDWPKLRAHLGVSRLSLPDADEALRRHRYERYTTRPSALEPRLARHRGLVHRRVGQSRHRWRAARRKRSSRPAVLIYAANAEVVRRYRARLTTGLVAKCPPNRCQLLT